MFGLSDIGDAWNNYNPGRLIYNQLHTNTASTADMTDLAGQQSADADWFSAQNGDPGARQRVIARQAGLGPDPSKWDAEDQAKFDATAIQVDDGIRQAMSPTRIDQVTAQQIAAPDAQRDAQIMAALGRSNGLLEGAANGTAPSAAQGQFQLANDTALAQQLGMAARARGGQMGAALRSATWNQGQMAGQAALQSGMLRANEMAQARSTLAGALQAQGQTDASWQGQRAQQTLDALRANQSSALGAGQGNQSVNFNSAQLDAQRRQQRAQNMITSRQGAGNTLANKASTINQGAEISNKANAGYMQMAGNAFAGGV
jgi:hypothetical protein